MDLGKPNFDAIPAIGAVGLFVIGVLLLKESRQSSTGAVAFAWLTIVSGFAIFVAAFGAPLGVFYALFSFSLTGYAAVALKMEWRAGSRSVTSSAAEPEERLTNLRRAIFKALLAIVLAGTAAFGLGVAFAVAMPMAAPNRMVIGALLVPILWGGGMAWTLADAKLLRAAIALLTVAAVSFAIAFLPKVIH